MQRGSQHVVEHDHNTTRTSVVHIVTGFPTPFFNQMLLRLFANSPRLRIGVNCASGNSLALWCALERPRLVLFHPVMLHAVAEAQISLRSSNLSEPTWVAVASHTDSTMLMQLATMNIDHILTSEQIEDICGLADSLLHYAGGEVPPDPRIAHARRVLAIARDESDRQILFMLAAGHKNSEIAATVYLSEQTVKNRLSQMMKAAHVSNRTELALLFCAARYEIASRTN